MTPVQRHEFIVDFKAINVGIGINFEYKMFMLHLLFFNYCFNWEIKNDAV